MFETFNPTSCGASKGMNELTLHQYGKFPNLIKIFQIFPNTLPDFVQNVAKS